MKIVLTFKTPDVVDEAIAYNALEVVDATNFKEVASQFVEYDEYIYVEIDTDKETATVLKV